MPVLGHSFGVMARLAKRLPIVLIPKQLTVAPMGNDMINHYGFLKLPALTALNAQGLRL